MAQTTFRAGDLTAVIGDNSAADEHRAGYNGLWSLTHRTEPANLFVPTVAGLNLEHIFDGDKDDADKNKVFYEPRNSPITHSPSGGGVTKERQTTNPAWDFQYILPQYEVKKEYTLQARLVYRERCDRAEVLREVEKGRRELR
jgi:hypothetical protein